MNAEAAHMLHVGSREQNLRLIVYVVARTGPAVLYRYPDPDVNPI